MYKDCTLEKLKYSQGLIYIKRAIQERNYIDQFSHQYTINLYSEMKKTQITIIKIFHHARGTTPITSLNIFFQKILNNLLLNNSIFDRVMTLFKCFAYVVTHFWSNNLHKHIFHKEEELGLEVWIVPIQILTQLTEGSQLELVFYGPENYCSSFPIYKVAYFYTILA